MKNLLTALTLLLLSSAGALAQAGPGPGPTPGPWTVDGATIYYNGGGVLVGTATGGGLGVGTENISSGYYVNGVPLSINGPQGSQYAVQYNAGNTSLGGTLLGDGQLLLGQTGAAPAARTMNGDCILSDAAAIVCTKTNGVALGTFATQNYATPPVIGSSTPNGGNFTDLTATTSFTATGLVTNADLANPSTTVNGQVCALGGSCTLTATASAALTIGTHLTGTSYNGSSPVTIATDATPSNTASTIMARDGSGQVAATTFTGALTGHASLDLALASLGVNVQSALSNPLNGSGGVLGTSLASADLFIGNGSGIAAGVPMSGDATISNTGALTLATSGVTAGTYGDGTHSTQVTFDAKGRATSASSVTITHASGDLAAANNLSDLASASTARGNLGLGNLATQNAGTGLANSGGSLNLQPAQNATIGGVEAIPSASHQWIAYIDQSGIPHQSQPSFADISGTNGVASGGTGNTSLTTNVIYKGAGTSPMVASSCSDTGFVFQCSEPTSLGGNALLQGFTTGSAASTGQVLVLDASGDVEPATTSTTDGFVGIAHANAASSGVAFNVAIAGQHVCLFDGPTTAKDWVVFSSTVAGDCHDTGSATRATGQYQIGQVLSTNASAGTYAINIENQYTPAGGGGGGSPGGSTGAIQYNNGGSFGGVTVASGDLMAGGGSGAPTDTGVPIFIGTGDGTTNNYTAFQASCNAGGAYIPAGTYVIDLLSATTLCTPPTGTVFRGAGQGKTTLKFVAADTNQVNVFNIDANKIDFKDMTIQIIPPTGGTMILYNMQNADGLNLIDDEISSNAVEGLTIGGTATAGDTLNVAFLRSGTTTTVSTTVTSGQTTAQMATAVAAAINANGTVSGWGAVATASGSFVGIAQPDTLTPQASYTLSVTGSATETLTAGFSNLSVVFNNQTNGDEADDVLVQNVYMHDLVYSVLKSNTSTQTNRRWSFRGGNYDRVFAGFMNINSPSGTFTDVDVDGISGGATGLNDLDALPIAASNVQNMTVRGVRFSGTYNQNVFHFEENSSVSTADDIAYEATSGNAGVGYNGTCLYTVDNDIGVPGTFKGVKNSSFDGITCIKSDSNSQGYGAWLAINTVASDGNSLTNFKAIGWPGGVRNDGFQHFILGPFSLTNFGPSTGTTAIINNQATGTILNFIPNNYATGLNNAGGASRPSSCTGTTC